MKSFMGRMSNYMVMVIFGLALFLLPSIIGIISQMLGIDFIYPNIILTGLFLLTVWSYTSLTAAYKSRYRGDRTADACIDLYLPSK